MARIELRHTTIRLVDGYSNTALINDSTLAVGDTTVGIDGLGTAEIVPLSTRFTVVGSGDVYTISAQDGNGILSVNLGGASGGTWTVTVAGNTSSTIVFNPTIGAVLTGVETISGVSSGDFTVTGAGTGGDPFIIKSTAGGAFGNVAFTISGDLTSLTGESGDSATQTEPGGVTHDITFSPSFKTANVPADDAVVTITGRTLEVKVGDGNATYTQSKEFNYDLDRGDLDSVREGDQQPMDWTVDFTWEFLKSIAGAVTPTIEEVFEKVGPAATWVSSSADPCEPFSIDIEIEQVPNCSTDQIETITLPDCRHESLEHDIDAASVSASGRSNATTPIKARRAQIA